MRDWAAEVRSRLEGNKLAPEDEERIVEELAQHLEDFYADLIRDGAGDDPATRRTLEELEDGVMLREGLAALVRTKPEAVALGGPKDVNFARDRWSDLRYGVRLLLRNPLYAAALVITLGVGIGVNTAVFSVVDAILLQPFPFDASERLVMVWETDRNSGTTHEPASWPDVRDFEERSETVEEFGSLMGAEATWINGNGEAERLTALAVTPNLPALLGFRPSPGTLLDAPELRTTPAVLISQNFWRERLGGTPSVVGSSLTLNGQSFVIAGVVPNESDLGVAQIHSRADYTAPFLAGQVDVWMSTLPNEESFPRRTHPWLTLGRLRPEATAEEAQAELAGIAAELEASFPENEGRGVNVEMFQEVVFGPSKPTLLALIGAAGLVLLITFGNVSNMMFVRMSARRREIAVRTAIGARHSRIALQLISETLVATAIGACLGAAFSWLALEGLLALAPQDIPRIDEAQLNGRALAFTAIIGSTVGVLLGLVPLAQTRGSDLRSSLQEAASRGSSAGRSGSRVRAAVVIGQTALAFALVIWAGLLLRSLLELQRVDPGIATAGVLKAEFQLPPSRYPLDFERWPDLPEINNFAARLLAEVEAIPGVESAALAGAHPFDAGVTNSFIIEGREAESVDFAEIRTRFISADYLETVQLPLLSGRFLHEADDARATPVAVVNQAAVNRYFRNGQPIGQQVRFWGVTWQIVGVAGDERFLGLNTDVEPAIYVPILQAPQTRAVLLVRSAGDPLSLSPALRATVRELDSEIALYGIQALDETLAGSLSRSRFTAVMVTLLGASAILLALLGLYGVLSFTVARRRAEMGIRLALGASRLQVRWVVVGEGMRLAAAGVVLGAAMALATSAALTSLLFGIPSFDPVTYVGVALITMAAAFAACWLPAQRASRADPIVVLRSE